MSDQLPAQTPVAEQPAAFPAEIDGVTIGRRLTSGAPGALGATGETFEATTRGPDGRQVPVVIKFVHPTRARLADWIDRFARPTETPTLARYVKVDTRRTRRWSGYLVVDRFGVLNHVADADELAGGFTIEERVRLVADAADAVAVLHGMKLAHGYLKPSNILVRIEDGAPVPIITDLGVRPVYEPAFHDRPDVARDLYPYLAPEAVQAFRGGGDLDSLPAAADVYALGALLCHALAGTAPGIAELEATVEDILAAKARPVFFNALLDPKAPVRLEELNRLLSETLSPSPAARPAAKDVAARLRAAAPAPAKPPAKDQ